ncbi:MAG: hypothetical protein K5867_06660 [Bacteroidales bacterium]|nr:hypothetical protein [Bacteroidales bacterium]
MLPPRKRILCPSYHLFSIVMTENAWDKCLSLVTSDVEDGSTFEDAYVRTIPWGAVKILEIKYAYKTEDHQRNFTIDAEGFVKAILKDALGDDPGIRIMRQLP